MTNDDAQVPPAPSTDPASEPPAAAPEPPPAISESAQPSESSTPPSPIVQDPPPQPPAPSPVPRQSAGAHMRAVVQTKKRKRLDKIVALAAQTHIITNDDAQKLLQVSDSTATRYLKELVKTGRLKLSGKRKHERYEPL